MRTTRLARLAAIALALGAPAQAYYHYVHYLTGGRTGPFTLQQEKFNIPAGGTVSFFVSDQGPAVYAPGDSFGSLLGQVKQALAAWDSVSSPNLRVKFGGLETDGQSSTAPGGDVVFQELPPGLYGMGGPTSNGTTIVRGTVILSNNTNAATARGQATWKTSSPRRFTKWATPWACNTPGPEAPCRRTCCAIPRAPGPSMPTMWPPSTCSMARPGGRTTSARLRAPCASPTAPRSRWLRWSRSAPPGAAVSSLTNPDGTYRIDGIPAGNYLLYVHPLPPDAVPADGTGLRPPQDQNGGPFLPNGVFGTVFYPNTTDPQQATTLDVRWAASPPVKTSPCSRETRSRHTT